MTYSWYGLDTYNYFSLIVIVLLFYLLFIHLIILVDPGLDLLPWIQENAQVY